MTYPEWSSGQQQIVSAWSNRAAVLHARWPQQRLNRSHALDSSAAWRGVLRAAPEACFIADARLACRADGPPATESA